MFTQIDIERARNKWSIKDLAAKTGITYTTLLSKLNGQSEFTLSEMFRIQAAFNPKIPLETLFKADKERTA